MLSSIKPAHWSPEQLEALTEGAFEYRSHVGSLVQFPVSQPITQPIAHPSPGAPVQRGPVTETTNITEIIGAIPIQPEPNQNATIDADRLIDPETVPAGFTIGGAVQSLERAGIPSGFLALAGVAVAIVLISKRL